MNRRAFLAALASFPFVRHIVSAPPVQAESAPSWFETPRFDAGMVGYGIHPIACRVYWAEGGTEDFPIEVLAGGAWRCTLPRSDRVTDSSLVWTKTAPDAATFTASMTFLP
jgi:hypothetical protein